MILRQNIRVAAHNRIRVWRLLKNRKTHLVEELMAARASFCDLEEIIVRRLGENFRPQLPESIGRLFIQQGGPASLASDYEARHRRTIDLTARSIEHLQKNGLRISLRTIQRTSRLVDPAARGISRRAVLLNADAYDIYRKSAAWPYKLKAQTVTSPQFAGCPRIRERIGRLKKAELACAIVELLNVNKEMEAAIMRANLVAVKAVVAGLS